MIDTSRILILAPHCDDEMACFGFLNFGANIKYIAFSSCDESVPTFLPGDSLRKESGKFLSSFGIKDVFIFGYTVRIFPEVRQEILERLVGIQKEYRPTLVLLPSSKDIHQDHRVIHEEGMRAFRECTVLGFSHVEIFDPGFYIKLSLASMEEKVKSLSFYPSQAHRPYFNPDAVRARARMCGLRIRADWAESYEPFRVVV